MRTADVLTLFLRAGVLALLAACDDSPCGASPFESDTQTEAGADTDADVFPPLEECPGGRWDPVAGLCWQDPMPAEERAWADALAHCDDLDAGGTDDWRLPSISELRSLIRSCPGTGNGGHCNVSDDCLETWCWNEACIGCPALGGPGGGGCYWDPDLDGPCEWLWSASVTAVAETSAWYVSFRDGIVNHTYVCNEARVRCVRDVSLP